MISVMALIQTAQELTDDLAQSHLRATSGENGVHPSVLGQVFNRVADRSQKGINYARGGVELDAISQFFFSDISSSMTAASEGAVELTAGLPASILEDMQLILCLQNTVIQPPEPAEGIKRMSILRKRPDVSAEEFQEQWFNLHALLVKRLPGISGYRQNIVLDGPRDAEGHMMVDGMVELWFPDGETIDAAFGSDIGTTTMTHAREFISEITTFLVDPIELSGCR